MNAAWEPTQFRLEIANLLVSVKVDSGAALVPGPDYLPFTTSEEQRPPDLRL